MYTIGIDVGGTKVKLGLFDGDMQIIEQDSFLTDKEASACALTCYLTAKVRGLLERRGLGFADLRGVGAAFPGAIDFEHGRIIEASNLIGYNDQPVRDMLQTRMGVPVFVDNDANCAALAEHRFGAGRGQDHMIYACLATGIGGGLILNGRLYRGMHGMAGEIGHMFVSDSTGYPCGCGVIGCVQSISSGTYMARYAMDRIKEGEDSRILDYAGTLSNIDTLAVGRALAMNDPLALEVVNRGAEYLGRMFHSLNEIFDINVFVYGGGITKLGGRFIDRMVAAYRHYTLSDQKYPARFLPAELGDRSELIGAALLVPEEGKAE